MTPNVARRAAFTAVYVALAFGGAGSAAGETGPIGQLPPQPTPRGEIVGDTPAVVVAYDGDGGVIARRTYRRGGGGGGGGSTWRCVYYRLGGTAPGADLPFQADTTFGAIVPDDGQPVILSCYDDNRRVYEDFFVYHPALPFGTLDAGAEAALLARELLPLPDPDIATSPPADQPQLVGVATWFAIATTWQTYTATATLAGTSATVTATPTSVRWDPGDGTAPITCTTAGATFDPAHPDTTTDCAHTYQRHTPAGTTLALTATITYTIAWTATDGTADTLDPLTRTTTIPLTIGDAQALVR